MSVDTDVLEELRASARSVVERAADRRRFADTWNTEPIDEALWSQAVDLGWTGLLVDERHGGAGAGLQAALVVVEELGRRVATVPYVSSAVLGASALAFAGSPDQQRRWLPAVAGGERRATVALTGPDGRAAPARLPQAIRDRDSWVLRGESGFVLDGSDADLLVVAAQGDDGRVRTFLVERDAAGVSSVAELNVDRSRRCATLTFDDVRLDADVELSGGDGEAVDRLHQRAGLALAADALGVARRALDISVAYANERKQFGRPIGSFQAIKHKLADMYVLVQGAAAALTGAARAVDASAPDAVRLSSVAAAYVRDAASKVTGDAIQVHGGIGYTWEHECHRLFKRAVFDELFLRPPAAFRDDLAELVLAPHRHVAAL
jgi:alkylation response protein AidB-like acyl-CoA dehydrogenase